MKQAIEIKVLAKQKVKNWKEISIMETQKSKRMMREKEKDDGNRLLFPFSTRGVT